MHALLPSGEQVLNDLFRGFSDELISEGAIRIRPDGGVSWWQDGGYRIGSDGPPFLFSSRPFLEGQVRRRVRARPNVSFLSGTADSLVVEAGSVGGLRVRTGEDTTTMEASLVVDASGRSGQLNRWLTEAGAPTPRVDQVHVDIQYTRRVLPEGGQGDLQPVASQSEGTSSHPGRPGPNLPWWTSSTGTSNRCPWPPRSIRSSPAQFQRVANLLAPPPTLMKPGVAFRVWEGARQVKAARVARPAPAPSAPVGATD